MTPSLNRSTIWNLTNLYFVPLLRCPIDLTEKQNLIIQFSSAVACLPSVLIFFITIFRSPTRLISARVLVSGHVKHGA